MNYPEHERLQKVKDDSQRIGEFLEWLADKYTVCEPSEESQGGITEYIWLPVDKPIERLLAEYFDINLEALEKEKKAMLQEMREEKA